MNEQEKNAKILEKWNTPIPDDIAKLITSSAALREEKAKILIGRCKDCKFFRPLDGGGVQGVRREKAGMCALISRPIHNKLPESQACMATPDDPYIELIVDEMFGCVHFTEAECRTASTTTS